MLYLLLGRARSGKSAQLFREIAKNGAARRQLLLVPEQASFETERRLCQLCGNSAALYAEVFSFTSLSQRIFSRYGGSAAPVLDEGGRMLVMYAAMQTVKDRLTMFGRFAGRPEFLKSLLQAVDELKSCCVQPEALGEIAEMAEGSHEEKLRDLSLIYAVYDAMTKAGAADPRDRLTRLEEKLQTVDFAADTDIYIDGFVDFTVQEERIIAQLLRKAHSVTVALSCDRDEAFHNSDVFTLTIRTAERLRRIAKESFVACHEETMPPLADGSALSRVEESLLLNLPLEAKAAEGTVEVFTAETPRQELLWTAGKIRQLVKERGIRYRDIAVSARDIAPYQDLIDSIFTQAGIPVFQSVMEDVLQKPVFVAVTAALEAASAGFAYEPLFRYLKSGLANLTQEECDLLENYALLWKLRGSQWSGKKGFVMHPRGYHQPLEEADEAQLERLNDIRRRVINPFARICKGEATVAEHVRALYAFLDEIALPERLMEKRAALIELGEVELAQEYDQMWDILCLGLEQCDLILGETRMEAEEFSRLLALLFAQYRLGTIPLSLDRVIVGDLPRLANRRMQVLFILGADEASLPQVTDNQGLLSLYERELLSDYGVPIPVDAEEQLGREKHAVYRACAQPTEALFVTWAKGQGGEKQPSYLVRRLRALFTDAEDETAQRQLLLNNRRSLRLLALETTELQGRLAALPEHQLYMERIRRARDWRRGSLSAPMTQRLYGRQIAMSASRIDRFNSCHFAYYMQFGLKAKPRKAVSFDAPEYGTFVHFVLEHVLASAKEGGRLADCDRETLQDMTRLAVERYVAEVLGGMEEQTPRFRYLFARLRRLVELVVENVFDELRRSEFQPIHFELGFGRGKDLPPVELQAHGLTLSISGYVDRVDGWLKGETLYLRVVDYKTGKKSFDHTEIWNGIGLQMLLYLFALADRRDFFGGNEVVPAAALYLPARDVVIDGSRRMDEAVRQKKVDEALKRSGFLLDAPEVIEAMEDIGDDGPRFLPVKLAKTGEFTGDNLVNAERLAQLKGHIEIVLKDICHELSAGTISANPFWRGERENACQYCDYKTACHFDEAMGKEKRRWLPKVSAKEFWAKLADEEQEVEKR